MPTAVGNSENGSFKYLSDRVWSHVLGWLELLLFVGGKEVLIKIYVLLQTRGLCKGIETLIRGFWWGSKKWEEEDLLGLLGCHTMPKYMGV
jgi:hypothetical protein